METSQADIWDMYDIYESIKYTKEDFNRRYKKRLVTAENLIVNMKVPVEEKP